MEVSFAELKEKEMINIFDGKKLGRVVDILFDNSSGVVKGVIVPGEKKIFRKSDDIFIPLERLRKIGDDVILVSMQPIQQPGYARQNYVTENSWQGYLPNEKQRYYNDAKNGKSGVIANGKGSYVRYKRIDNKKYK